jgi:hypothetical protein
MYNLNFKAFKEAIKEVGTQDVEFVEYEGILMMIHQMEQMYFDIIVAGAGENSDLEDEQEMEGENDVEDLEDRKYFNVPRLSSPFF